MHRVYLIAQGGQESLVIYHCVFQNEPKCQKNSHDCSLSMQSGSQLLFCPAFSWWYSGCHMYCIYCKGILIWQINCFINNLHAYLELALPSCFFESNRYHCKIMFIFLPLKWICYTFVMYSGGCSLYRYTVLIWSLGYVQVINEGLITSKIIFSFSCVLLKFNKGGFHIKATFLLLPREQGRSASLNWRFCTRCPSWYKSPWGCLQLESNQQPFTC